MPIRLSRFVLPAVLAATIPAAAVFAQTQTQGAPPATAAGPSQETMTRLEDGRIAMIKGALRLNDEQLKLWAPVEQQIRASFAARQEARMDRRERRQSSKTAERPALPDRLDRASKRMAERAERMKTYAEAIRPFYASLTDDQQAVAGVVLGRSTGLARAHGQRWSMHRGHRGER